MASFDPVDAPEGTAARPLMPDSSTTSASMVGLPRESRISRAMTSTMALMISPCRFVVPARSPGNLVVANDPIGDLALNGHHLLVLGIRTVGIEVGPRGECHVDAVVVGDRAIGRIPAVFEADDAATVLR